MEHVVKDLSGYTWRWVLNAVLGLLLVLSVIQNVVIGANITGAWLGVSDIAWHWVLFSLAIATALNTLVNHTPPIHQPPWSSNRIAVENRVQEIRKTA